MVESLNSCKFWFNHTVCFFQYSVSLKAEPDHKTLGFRLKGAFKDVMKEIKLLNDDQLTDFVKTGTMQVDYCSPFCPRT